MISISVNCVVLVCWLGDYVLRLLRNQRGFNFKKKISRKVAKTNFAFFASLRENQPNMRVYLSIGLLLSAMLVTVIAAAGNPPPRPASQMYRRYCVSCHGSDGKAKTSKGKYSHARDLTDAQWHADVSDERIFNSIMNGRNVRGNMPAFSDKLKENDVDSLVSFVRGLKAK